MRLAKRTGVKKGRTGNFLYSTSTKLAIHSPNRSDSASTTHRLLKKHLSDCSALSTFHSRASIDCQSRSARGSRKVRGAHDFQNHLSNQPYQGITRHFLCFPGDFWQQVFIICFCFFATIKFQADGGAKL